MTLTTIPIGPDARRRILASPEGVLIFAERRAQRRGGSAWCIVGCHLVPARDWPRCSLDVREAFEQAHQAPSGEGHV